jgi:hypothetical protein
VVVLKKAHALPFLMSAGTVAEGNLSLSAGALSYLDEMLAKEGLSESDKLIVENSRISPSNSSVNWAELNRDLGLFKEIVLKLAESPSIEERSNSAANDSEAKILFLV